jgi:hypothetical protein
MSDTIWTPLQADIVTPKWCDGTAFYYPTQSKPLSLTAYNQIVQIRNAIVPNALRDEWLLDKALTCTEIKTFKEAINEHQFNYPWTITPGSEKYFHADDINELRRLATYPNTLKQIVTNESAILDEWCIEYVTSGMQILAECAGSSSEGWQSFVGTKVADENTSHRFWIWTQYPEYHDWLGASVGIIGLDGRIKAPIGGSATEAGDWQSGPQSGQHDNANWWLIQLVQDIHSPLNEVATVTKPLKGLIFGQEEHYTTTTEIYYENCVPATGDTQGTVDKVTRYTWSSNCNYWVSTYVQHLTHWHTSCDWYNSHVTYTSTGTSPAEFDLIEIGESFFHTWEFYMDQL